MFKFMYDLIIDPLGLPIEWYYEWVILAIVDMVAYKVAYNKVGALYHDGSISGKSSGSFVHWLIRTFLFVNMWAVTYVIIYVRKFVISHAVEVGIGMVIVLVIVIACKEVIGHINKI